MITFFLKKMENITPREPQLSTSGISEVKQVPISEEAYSSLVCPLSLLTGSFRTRFSSKPRVANAAATTTTSGSVELRVSKIFHSRIILFDTGVLMYFS
jgi:hypothetical protein